MPARVPAVGSSAPTSKKPPVKVDIGAEATGEAWSTQATDGGDDSAGGGADVDGYAGDNDDGLRYLSCC